MQRRDALKNIGLSVGSISMTSTIAGLMKSCTSPKSDWEPRFFNASQAKMVTKTLDVILPATPGILGAKELNLAQFLDGYFLTIYSKEDQEIVRSGAENFLLSTLEYVEKDQVDDLSHEDVEVRLAYYLKSEESQQNEWQQEVNEQSESPSSDSLNFRFLGTLRSRGISAFKISKIIGSEVLAYDPIPGRQEGCIDLQETTKGKAWSL